MYLTVHFFAVIAYSFPYPANKGSKLKYYVFPYIYPYFHQSWSLFVPVPKENFSLYMRVDNEEWKDVFQEIVQRHQSNRFSGNEALMLSLSNALRYYASTVKEENTILKDDGSNLNFEVIKKIVLQLHKIESGNNFDHADIIIVTKNIAGEPHYAHYYRIDN